MQRNIKKLLGVKLVTLIPAIVYTGIITYLSLVNLSDTSVGGWGVSDKVLHAVAYFGMALVWLVFYVLNYQPSTFLRKIIVVCLLVVAFGIIIEVLQNELTSYRELDLLDMLANTSGVILAGVLIKINIGSLMRLKSVLDLVFKKK